MLLRIDCGVPPGHVQGKEHAHAVALNRERDSTFGQAMFKLRTSIGLTQASLTDLLWVPSRDKLGQQSTGECAETATRNALEVNRTFA